MIKKHPASFRTTSAYDQRLGQFLSADPFACGAKGDMQATQNTQNTQNPQNYNRYAYCLNNPMKYTDPSGYTSYYVDGVEVSQTDYRMMGGAKYTSRAHGNFDFIADYQFGQKSLERKITIEPIFVGVSDGAFGGDGLFHSSINDASRTGLFGGMYNGSPFFTNSAESLSENGDGYLSGLALAKGGYSISFSLMEHWFSKPLPDVEIERNNPNFPGVTIRYERGRRTGCYIPGYGILVGEKSYMKTDQSWLQHEYGHYLQCWIKGPNYYLNTVIPNSVTSMVFNNSYSHDRQFVELEATTFAHNFFGSSSLLNNMSSPTFYNAKPIGIMSYQISLFKIGQIQRIKNYQSIPGLSK